MYSYCTQTSFARLAYKCTVNINCSIAEEFKSDDVVKITTETKDADVTDEVYIFLENRTNFDRELLGS